MDTQHTPGPWTEGKPLYNSTRNWKGIYSEYGTPNQWLIAEVQGNNTDSECGHNARLITAAPDLLESAHKNRNILTDIAKGATLYGDDLILWAKNLAVILPKEIAALESEIAKAEGK